MCESIAYLLTEQGEKKLMDNVIFAIPNNNEVYLEDILGENMTVEGCIKEIRLLDHKIILSK